jgi:hypothetical protein
VTVTRSVAAGNGGVGFYSGDSTASVINVESCTATMNEIGIFAFRTARVRNSMVTGNGVGLHSEGTILSFGTMITGNTTGLAGSGSRISFGNNGVHGNVTNGAFNDTVAQQ